MLNRVLNWVFPSRKQVQKRLDSVSIKAIRSGYILRSRDGNKDSPRSADTIP